MIHLTGITWDHTRGLVPLVAASQRFHEKHPNVRIDWRARTLREFAEQPVDALAQQFDFLIIDHPFAGQAARSGVFRQLDGLVSAEFLRSLADNSVGVSYRSYEWDNHLWALPIDAACPISHRRDDLLKELGISIPKTYEEVLQLARQNRVLVPGIDTDALHNFYMFCHAHGEEPFTSKEYVVSEEIGLRALETLSELMSLVPKVCRKMNPIAVLELLSTSDDYAYCPFAFGYSSYSQPGFSRRIVQSGDVVTFSGRHLLTSLGGTGIALSSRCKEMETAAEFIRFVCELDIQEHIYVRSGGQPGHRGAWLSDSANACTANYFRSALPALDRAWLRPRYPGHLHFQDAATCVVAEAQCGELKHREALAKINALYHESLALSEGCSLAQAHR